MKMVTSKRGVLKERTCRHTCKRIALKGRTCRHTCIHRVCRALGRRLRRTDCLRLRIRHPFHAQRGAVESTHCGADPRSVNRAHGSVPPQAHNLMQGRGRLSVLQLGDCAAEPTDRLASLRPRKRVCYRDLDNDCVDKPTTEAY